MVLSPASFADVKPRLKQDVVCRDGYALSAEITEDLATVIERSRGHACVRLTIFSTPMGVSFLAVTLQTGSLQLRYVGSFSQLAVQELACWSAHEERMQFVFDVLDTERLLFAAAPLPGADAVIFERMARQSRVVPLEEELTGLTHALHQLAAPGYMPSAFPSIEVRQVCMVGVLSQASARTDGIRSRTYH
jgi:hypothetical protein